MPVSLRTHPSFQILYLIAQDFVKLNTIEQFKIGMKFNLITTSHMALEDDEIELLIFKEAYDRNIIPELVIEIETILYKET